MAIKKETKKSTPATPTKGNVFGGAVKETKNKSGSNTSKEV